MLCKKCKNPETDVHIKDGRITLDCKACGQRSDVDLRQKLSSFILKQQPKKGKNKADKKARKEAKKAAERNGNGNSGSEEGSEAVDEPEEDVGIAADSDDELTRRINEGAKELEAAPEVKDDEWAVDTSEEAVRARAQMVGGAALDKLTIEDGDEDGDGEGGGNSPYEQLGAWVDSQAAEKGGVAEVDDIEIYVKAKELGIEGKYKTLTVLAMTIFDDGIVAQIPKRGGMLKKVNICPSPIP